MGVINALTQLLLRGLYFLIMVSTHHMHGGAQWVVASPRVAYNHLGITWPRTGRSISLTLSIPNVV